MGGNLFFTKEDWLIDVEGKVELGAGGCGNTILKPHCNNWFSQELSMDMNIIKGKVLGKQNIQMVSNCLPANYSVAKGKNCFHNGGYTETTFA